MLQLLEKDAVLTALKANIHLVLHGGMDDKIAGIDKAIKEKQAELLPLVFR